MRLAVVVVVPVMMHPVAEVLVVAVVLPWAPMVEFKQRAVRVASLGQAVVAAQMDGVLGVAAPQAAVWTSPTTDLQV